MSEQFCDGVPYNEPLCYVVLPPSGLVVRRECELDSEEVGRLAVGTEVHVLQRRLEPTGRHGVLMRVLLRSPPGWATELPRFFALADGQAPPTSYAGAASGELDRREAAAFNKRGEDLRLLLGEHGPDCVVLRGDFDLARLSDEVEAVVREHEFIEKTAVLHAMKSGGSAGWGSIPLRSLGGVVGDAGNISTGVQEQGSFADTPLMIHCPYIREVINDLSCEVWRVRLMRLRAGGVISPHKDNLQCHSIVRLHLPILTNDEVEFRIEEKPYHLTAGNLYFTNVRKSHDVANRSSTDRVHLVIDVDASLALQDQIRDAKKV